MYLYEHEMREPVCQWMLAQGLLPAVEFHLCHPVDIVGGRFGDRPAPRRIPQLVEVVAVELKLFAVATVIRQGRENRHLADKSYAAMPADRCKKMRENTLDAFYVAGVGLLSVDDSVSILIPAGAGDSCRRERVRKNLWRRTRHLYAILLDRLTCDDLFEQQIHPCIISRRLIADILFRMSESWEQNNLFTAGFVMRGWRNACTALGHHDVAERVWELQQRWAARITQETPNPQ